MGTVWIARDLALDREVALKVLHDRFLGAAHQERLAAEARAMARLSHPNVVAVYDVAERGGRTCIIMELVRGASLSHWLETPRTWQAIVEIFRAAAGGLAAAHAAGIVHRDVKPTNILVGDDGRPRVADFGVAHAAAARPEAGELVTADTTGLIGSPAYMAPEQLAGQPSDARTDQFGLCVSLYEALHGRRPFEAIPRTARGTAPTEAASTVGAQIMAITRGAPAPVREVPAWLHAVIVRGLAANPDARFPSMAALGAALAGPRSRRTLALGLAAGAVALAGAGSLVYAWTRSATQPVAEAAADARPADAVMALNAIALAEKPAMTPAADLDKGVDAIQPLAKAELDARNRLVDACVRRDISAAKKLVAQAKSRVEAQAICIAQGVSLDELVKAPAPPAPKLAPADARKRYRELILAGQAEGKLGDFQAARAKYIEALTYNVDHDTDGHAGAASASCQLSDRPAAVEHLKALPRTTNLGLNARHAVVKVCGRIGVDLVDVLDPDERRFP